MRKPRHRKKGDEMQMEYKKLAVLSIVGLLAGCQQPNTATQGTAPSASPGYTFERGFPVGDTAQKAYDDADLNRAVEAYRFFYPTVSGSAILKGNENRSQQGFWHAG
jgi:hypothetical protein